MIDFESESYDRPNMRLPSSSDTLANAILDANPNTAGTPCSAYHLCACAHMACFFIVVIQSGTPVEMPWSSKAPTILQAFYGGNEVGNGIGDVLAGKVNPSGKFFTVECGPTKVTWNSQYLGRLPLTFPHRLEDNPSYLNFGGENGKVHYGENPEVFCDEHALIETSSVAEGVFVGYRYVPWTTDIFLQLIQLPQGTTRARTNQRCSRSVRVSGKAFSLSGKWFNIDIYHCPVTHNSNILLQKSLLRLSSQTNQLPSRSRSRILVIGLDVKLYRYMFGIWSRIYKDPPKS